MDSNERFARTAVRRKNLFLVLSLAGVVVGLGLAVWFGYRRWADPSAGSGLAFVVVVLVLLNARANLRQYRFAVALERLLERGRD
ncbi:MAG: hypothetical protein GTN89_01690 [Acidobacteria bacterium]|nr:hypothetical protein [Acidobacteriota bacterium]NIM61429.1 hypothetical protein [Acidobacteriota bacterium]NIO58092.1 hypothetical protein [Acidobacteriota bacterium]NIQ29101.1 hypothetical protein [Acidobacteriota bacterium]NIQ83645.1 hypothetical protein [Acidobacteriota bacterium]